MRIWGNVEARGKNRGQTPIFTRPETLTRRFAPPSPSGRGNDLKNVPLPLGEGGAKRRVRVSGLLSFFPFHHQRLCFLQLLPIHLPLNGIQESRIIGQAGPLVCLEKVSLDARTVEVHGADV